MSYWLLKTEPETFSFEKLVKDGKTNWNGVRNFQARNFLRSMKTGDLCIIYHSGKDKAAVGLAKIIKEAYPDPDKNKPGDWVQVDLAPVKSFKKSVGLDVVKKEKIFSDLHLVKQARLSVMPVNEKHYKKFMELCGS